MMNGLLIQQQGQYYAIYTPTGQLIAQVFMGGDRQFIKDMAALNLLTKVLAARWSIAKPKQ